MKKANVWIVTVVAVLICTLCLTGCGSNVNVEGIYKFYTIEKADIKLNIGQDFMSYDLTEDFIIFDIKTDGKFTYKVALPDVATDPDGTITIDGTWEKTGDKIDFTLEGAKFSGSIEGDSLIIEETYEMGEVIKLTLKKSK